MSIKISAAATAMNPIDVINTKTAAKAVDAVTLVNMEISSMIPL